MLGSWTHEEKEEFAEYIARQYSVRHAWMRVCEGEDTHPYTYPAVARFAKSDEGKKLVKEATAVIRDEVREKSYSHSGSRIDALIEVAYKLLNMFRETEKPVDLARLSNEFRNCLSDIRLEIDPYGIENAESRSHFENILLGVQGLPKKQADMILGVTASSTGETETN